MKKSLDYDLAAKIYESLSTVKKQDLSALTGVSVETISRIAVGFNAVKNGDEMPSYIQSTITEYALKYFGKLQKPQDQEKTNEQICNLQIVKLLNQILEAEKNNNAYLALLAEALKK